MSTNQTPNTHTNTNTNEQPPSLVSSHVQYVQGNLEQTIGNVTGSQAWQDSGKKNTEAGLADMKAAGEARKATRDTQPATGGIGAKVEEVAGKVTGCEGMQEEGRESLARAHGGAQ